MGSEAVKPAGESAVTKVFDERSGLSLSARRTALLTFLQGSVEDVVRSKDVKEFCIGISGKPFARRRAYARWCDRLEMELRGFVVLDWGRTAEQILESERWLFHRLEAHRKYSRTVTRRYYPSAARHLADQVVYLAWWSW